MAMISAEELKMIVELTNTVPEIYRKKCFELLLTHTLQSGLPLPPLEAAPRAAHAYARPEGAPGKRPEAAIRAGEAQAAPHEPVLAGEPPARSSAASQPASEAAARFEPVAQAENTYRPAPAPVKPPAPPPAAPAPPPVQRKLVVHPEVKTFLALFGLKEGLLKSCFEMGDNGVRPIYQLKTKRQTRAQIEHTLMMALGNALVNGQFQVDLDVIRARCQEEKCYDRSIFMEIFEYNNNLFRAISEDQPLSLSQEGKSELAELLEDMQD